ncbi:deoxyribose-phosphate aldolase [Paraflavisolibacter sp. H34]|uniref:deoxyribose-phosphate aldolase n=1 Tax=Huijunlia imazamoxiresistens TaxID=3127457 RepID=UPI003018C4D4
MQIASYIDHTILKADTTLADIEKVCAEAVEYGFASVCIPPYFVPESVKRVTGSEVKVATVIGFPFGYHHYSAKVAEAVQAVNEGADELDVVMNIAAFKNGDFDLLEKEITGIAGAAKPAGVLIKVIIESGILNEAQIIRCCNFYKDFPVDFLKTSTGYAEKGASLEAVRLMRHHLPPAIHVKASGGIRTFEFAKSLVDAGAGRLGCSAGVAIVKGQTATGLSY